MRKNIVAFVPARAGSKGLPGKNTRLLCGKPLYMHAVDQARDAGIARIFVSTDITEILSRDHTDDVTLLARPATLAGDATPMEPVLLDFLSRYDMRDQIMVLLQPTSPLRRGADIRGALALYDMGGFDMVMSVTDHDRAVLKYGVLDGDRFLPINAPDYSFANRQSLPPVVRPNGAIYVLGADWLAANKGLTGGRMAAYRMSAQDSADIDGPEDFTHCEQRLLERGAD
ncbi:MAG: cytidylyltransferase domain-containing protein [Halocynthiibacter sp.]